MSRGRARRGEARRPGTRVCFFFSSRRRHTRFDCDWSSDVCSSDLASSLAAELYGAVVLEQDLEDHAENYTRFLMVARDSAPPELARKTSLVFTLPNVPGSLHRALGVFAARKLDLTKIESRPLAGRPWEYAFYLDVVGDPRAGVAEALPELHRP